VLPTIRTFTVGPGIPPGQPAAGCGRVADCHRRFGVTPTPEHVPTVYAASTPGPGARPPRGPGNVSQTSHSDLTGSEQLGTAD